jgi:hypothetical protein
MIKESERKVKNVWGRNPFLLGPVSYLFKHELAAGPLENASRGHIHADKVHSHDDRLCPPLAQEAEAAHLGLAGDGWMVGKREGKGKALAFGHPLQPRG